MQLIFPMQKPVSGSNLVKACVLASLAVSAPGVALGQKPGPPPAENAAFSEVWQRADYPVAEGRAQRSWLWGPRSFATKNEPLAESPGGFRQVQYYDKARMEVNNPGADRTSPWYVTNGLLVTEMISGRMQVGVNNFEQREPSDLAVAGDLIQAGPATLTPSYKIMASVASLAPGQNRSEPKAGQPILQLLRGDGSVSNLPSSAIPSSVQYQYFEQTSKHNIPNVFWAYMNQRGTLYENGVYRQGLVFNWLSAMGYPLTEPYWIEVSIAGKNSRILMQAFERRVLTYNPSNAPEWRVEMGNVGLQYYSWRYGTSPQPGGMPGGTTLAMKRIETSDTLKSGQYSGIEEPLYKAIVDQKAWSELWTRHTAKLDAFLPVPAVDFKNNFVVAAFWGNKPNGCYILRIESVSIKQGVVQVVVSQMQRTGGCTQVIVQPNDLVTVSRSGMTSGSYKLSFVGTDNKEIASGTVSIP